MLRRLLFVAAGLLFLCLSAMQASAATAAVATADVNMRAGPSTAYPVVAVVPDGARLVTYGCVVDYSWCDVSLGNYRGWVYSSYLTVVYRGAPVIVTAPVAVGAGIVVVEYNKVYWDAHYVGYPWYRRWAAYPPYAPNVDRSRTVECADGACTATRQLSGPNGATATRTRSCNVYDPANPACTVTRTGPNGGTVGGTRIWHRN